MSDLFCLRMSDIIIIIPYFRTLYMIKSPVFVFAITQNSTLRSHACNYTKRMCNGVVDKKVKLVHVQALYVLTLHNKKKGKGRKAKCRAPSPSHMPLSR